MLKKVLIHTRILLFLCLVPYLLFVLIIGNLGSVCLGLLYTVSALSNFLIPAVLYLVKSIRMCLIVSSFGMVYFVV